MYEAPPVLTVDTLRLGLGHWRMGWGMEARWSGLGSLWLLLQGKPQLPPPQGGQWGPGEGRIICRVSPGHWITSQRKTTASRAPRFKDRWQVSWARASTQEVSNWTGSSPQEPSLSHLAWQNLLYALRKNGSVTDLCVTEQEQDPGKRTTALWSPPPWSPRKMGTNLEFEKIYLGYPHLKTHSLQLRLYNNFTIIITV